MKDLDIDSSSYKYCPSNIEIKEEICLELPLYLKEIEPLLKMTKKPAYLKLPKSLYRLNRLREYGLRRYRAILRVLNFNSQ